MTGHPVLGRALLVGWLVVVWLALWGSVTFPNVVTGLLCGTALVLVFPPTEVRDDPFTVHPLPALSFTLWFAWALVVSNVSVAREVIVPKRRSSIRTAVVVVPLRTRSGRLATIIANAITLTPGTLTLDARGRPTVLFVHVLAFDSVDATREEVADLERRVVDAFGTAEERAAICGRTAGPAPEPVPSEPHRIEDPS
ncbi:Na+/H+ antiporter subunit E [Aquihabitans sp. G128]|uniref:Na+/H+ antiporter subunit E n=1 Tax=Aquihabitans sp. G128 TaxID=2849779 RepID=UPI001C23D261|nr:Na+/H+ antiporter subunit E [Aquihabitans sp. G128]QXC59657.1 Na+/H+ antiporter subunit E [Aquihabitans sp. G128]